MPTWGEIGIEISRTAQPGHSPDFDRVRRTYLAQLYHLTGRATIVYSSAFLEKAGSPGELLMITLADMQGFMEVVKGLPQGPLDIIIHSPGGLAEATESILRYLRGRFDPIRAFVPIAAKSAATMLALGCDEIVMGAHSELGPIDPQVTLLDPNGAGISTVPAQAILDEFERARNECADSKNIPAWVAILRGYHPGLLQTCSSHQALAQEMVGQWLAQYMLRRIRNRVARGKKIAKWFSDHKHFKSHGRQVSRDQARGCGVFVVNLESDPQLQDAVLSVHHALSHTFSSTGAVKIIENHEGRAFIRSVSISPVLTMQSPRPESMAAVTLRGARMRSMMD